MDSNNNLFRKFPTPQWMNNASIRVAGVYMAGALFSFGFFTFLDAAIFSHSPLNGSDIHIRFVDWVPILCSTLGLIITSSLEKSRLSADSFSYSGNGVAWKARVVLFLGFALIAGGMAGSVCVLVLKFVVNEDGGQQDGLSRQTMWMGIANVLANALVMLSCAVLWVSQNMDDEYSYNLQL